MTAPKYVSADADGRVNAQRAALAGGSPNAFTIPALDAGGLLATSMLDGRAAVYGDNDNGDRTLFLLPDIPSIADFVPDPDGVNINGAYTARLIFQTRVDGDPTSFGNSRGGAWFSVNFNPLTGTPSAKASHTAVSILTKGDLGDPTYPQALLALSLKGVTPASQQHGKLETAVFVAQQEPGANGKAVVNQQVLIFNGADPGWNRDPDDYDGDDSAAGFQDGTSDATIPGLSSVYYFGYGTKWNNAGGTPGFAAGEVAARKASLGGSMWHHGIFVKKNAVDAFAFRYHKYWGVSAINFDAGDGLGARQMSYMGVGTDVASAPVHIQGPIPLEQRFDYVGSATAGTPYTLAPLNFFGRTSFGTTTIQMAGLEAQVTDPTHGAEVAAFSLKTIWGGTLVERFRLGQGLYDPSAFGGDMGPGSVNARSLYINGVLALGVDTSAPAQPATPTATQSTRVSAAGTQQTIVTWTWTANTEADLDGYDIELSRDFGPFHRFRAPTNTYDVVANGGESQRAKIVARDNAQPPNKSLESAVGSYTVLGDSVAPTGSVTVVSAPNARPKRMMAKASCPDLNFGGFSLYVAVNGGAVTFVDFYPGRPGKAVKLPDDGPHTINDSCVYSVAPVNLDLVESATKTSLGSAIIWQATKAADIQDGSGTTQSDSTIITSLGTSNDTTNVNGTASSTITANLATAYNDVIASASDNVISRAEKKNFKRSIDAITNEQASLDAQATAQGIVTEKTAYDSSITALTAYLATCTTPVLWSDKTGTTTVVSTTLTADLNAVYSARAALLAKLSAAASQTATWSTVTGTGKPADNADVTGSNYAKGTLVDTSRPTTNSPPSFYSLVIEYLEEKTPSSIGITTADPTCLLKTATPHPSSGNVIQHVRVSDGRYRRSGAIGGSTWTAWDASFSKAQPPSTTDLPDAKELARKSAADVLNYALFNFSTAGAQALTLDTSTPGINPAHSNSLKIGGSTSSLTVMIANGNSGDATTISNHPNSIIAASIVGSATTSLPIGVEGDFINSGSAGQYTPRVYRPLLDPATFLLQPAQIPMGFAGAAQAYGARLDAINAAGGPTTGHTSLMALTGTLGNFTVVDLPGSAFGTAAVLNVGTSGASVIPTLDGANTWAGIQSFSGHATVTAAAGTFRSWFMQTTGVNRWAFYADNVAESGSNNGSNFALNAYNDAGTSLGTVFTASRATQVLNFTQPPTFSDAATTRGNLGLAALATKTQASLTADVSGVLPVNNGGLGTFGGNSGGIPYYSAISTMASTAALTNHAILLGGGAGGAPTALASLGTTTGVLHGNAAGAPTWSQVDLTADVTGVLPVANLPVGTSSSTVAAGNDSRITGAAPLASPAFTGNVSVTGNITFGGFLRPTSDNTSALGSGSFRMSTLFAGTGTINTSDEAEKCDAQELPQGLIDAICAMPFWMFKFKDSVAIKGSAARWHFGMMAQRVAEALTTAGYDPAQYGLYCADPLFSIDQVTMFDGSTVEVQTPVLDEDGQQAVRLGLRMDYLYSIRLEGDARRIADLDSRLTAVEQRLAA